MTFFKRLIIDTKFRATLSEHRYCNYLFIGSANVYKLIDRSITLKDNHSYFYTLLPRLKGRVPENDILRQDTSIQKGFCVKSQLIPFIVASPDGLVINKNDENEELVIVEVKSSPDYSQLDEIEYGYNDQVNYQVQTSIEIFTAKKCVLYLSHYDPESGDRPSVYKVYFIDHVPVLSLHFDLIIEVYSKNIFIPFLQQEFNVSFEEHSIMEILVLIHTFLTKRSVRILPQRTYARLKGSLLKRVPPNFHCRDKYSNN